MPDTIDARKLEKRRQATVRSRAKKDKHVYFQGVANARYVLRKVFRMVEERARRAHIDPLAHQALIQIYGSPGKSLRVKDVADRLDISQAFASSLVRVLVDGGFAARSREGEDKRETQVTVTEQGIALLTGIDSAVQADVDAFTEGLSEEEKEQALSILLFYVGTSIESSDGTDGRDLMR
ncbi:MAG: MarR family transcriptional regulator [Pigmentiphaga sp.]|uniref:MarR family winged helix-turn-helix transcriptional regulator n=1 Tax=Pigmentiphaga sp. TaxID=1977564 RepID=UPI0029BA124D|nr:MarR family transcriptional regulator [Pigmentiphaga sp.]MDX3904641.1 MarR family transcriptional regulator [Pigmentiphaga sp.]